MTVIRPGSFFHRLLSNMGIPGELGTRAGQRAGPCFRPRQIFR